MAAEYVSSPARLRSRCSPAKAFLSYSRKDKTFVHALAEALKQKDVSLWADWNDLRPAVPWQDDLMRQISFKSDGFQWLPDSTLETQSSIWSVTTQRGERILSNTPGPDGPGQIRNLAFANSSTLISADVHRVDRWYIPAHSANQMQTVNWLDANAFMTQDANKPLNSNGTIAFESAPPHAVHRWDVVHASNLPDMIDPDGLDERSNVTAVSPAGLIAVAGFSGIRVWDPDQPNKAQLLCPALLRKQSLLL